MKQMIILLALLAAVSRLAVAAPSATNSPAAGRVLLLETSTMRMPTAKATLIVGPLTLVNGAYVGDYRVKVFPYFFKNEKGRLEITVPDAPLTAFYQGRAVTISGTATTTKSGKSRPVEIAVTPADLDHGTVNLWFMAGSQKMTFEPAYHFDRKTPNLLLAQTTRTNLAANRPPPASTAAAAAGN